MDMNKPISLKDFISILPKAIRKATEEGNVASKDYVDAAIKKAVKNLDENAILKSGTFQIIQQNLHALNGHADQILLHKAKRLSPSGSLPAPSSTRSPSGGGNSQQDNHDNQNIPMILKGLIQ